MNAYCIFCNALKREEIALIVKQRLNVEVLAPKIIQRKWVKGKATEVVHDYLSGYVFMYSEARIQDFSQLFRVEGLYRILGEKSKGYCLDHTDRDFAEMLWACDGIIGVMKACKSGDRVRLVQGALGKVDGEIVRLDRRGRALIRFNFDGSPMQSWVAVEMIEDEARSEAQEESCSEA